MVVVVLLEHDAQCDRLDERHFRSAVAHRDSARERSHLAAASQQGDLASRAECEPYPLSSLREPGLTRPQYGLH